MFFFFNRLCCSASCDRSDQYCNMNMWVLCLPWIEMHEGMKSREVNHVTEMREAALCHSGARKREHTNWSLRLILSVFFVLTFGFIYFSHTLFVTLGFSKHLALISKTILKLMKWITLAIMHTVSGQSKSEKAVFHSGAVMVNHRGWCWIRGLPELCIIGEIFQEPEMQERRRRKGKSRTRVKIIFHFLFFLSSCSVWMAHSGPIRRPDDHLNGSWNVGVFSPVAKWT